MKISKSQWFEEHQSFEKEWWGDCVNTLGEELKQKKYASFMGLEFINHNGQIGIDVQNKSILDIGGGAVSLLLKTFNLARGVVVEPMKLPAWVLHRYITANIDVSIQPAEEFTCSGVFDEIWIYNVLQHTINPKKIVENAVKYAKVVRIFEWLDTPPHKGHPQTLRELDLNKWLGGKGRVKELDPNEWAGFNRAYYGVFPTQNYDGKTNL